jgi:hypothetical protein
MSVLLQVEAVNSATARVTASSAGRSRFNGWVMVGVHKTRAYVAKWHPQDAGNPVWP